MCFNTEVKYSLNLNPSVAIYKCLPAVEKLFLFKVIGSEYKPTRYMNNSCNFVQLTAILKPITTTVKTGGSHTLKPPKTASHFAIILHQIGANPWH